jgi:hypothetical protein
MRKGLVVIGVVLLILGVLVAGLSYQQTTGTTIPTSPSALSLTLGTVIAGTMTVSWTGGGSSETINVFQCSSSSCGATGSPIAVGHGDSGSLSFGVSSGATYAIQATGSPASATVQISGFGIATFIGIILAAIGSFLLVIGIVAKPRVRAAPEEVAPPTAAAAPPSFAGETPGQTWHTGPRGQETIMKARVETPQAAQGTLQSIKCASCGTMNEPWLHNCRWCQRPLETTATG